MKKDFDTWPQIDSFDEYVDGNCEDRQQTLSGAYGYGEEEWEAFQAGWNAAKKHFGIEL